MAPSSHSAVVGKHQHEEASEDIIGNLAHPVQSTREDWYVGLVRPLSRYRPLACASVAIPTVRGPVAHLPEHVDCVGIGVQ